MKEQQAVYFYPDADGYKKMAIFVAQLTKEGVTWEYLDDSRGMCIKLTGGF